MYLVDFRLPSKSFGLKDSQLIQRMISIMIKLSLHFFSNNFNNTVSYFSS